MSYVFVYLYVRNMLLNFKVALKELRNEKTQQLNTIVEASGILKKMDQLETYVMIFIQITIMEGSTK